MGIFYQTTVNNQGCFQFNNRFSPFFTSGACLSSKDQARLISQNHIIKILSWPGNKDIKIGFSIVVCQALNYFDV
jgi:hypothetical protein